MHREAVLLQPVTPRFAVSKQRHGFPLQTGNSWRGGPVLTEPIILGKVLIKHKQRAGKKILCIVSYMMDIIGMRNLTV